MDISWSDFVSLAGLGTCLGVSIGFLALCFGHAVFFIKSSFSQAMRAGGFD